MYTTVIHIIYERSIIFLMILKLCEFSGFQTNLVFKQSFKYLKNEIINLSKVILKLECFFYLNIYYFILFYIRRAILTQTNAKKDLIEKKQFS